MSSPAYGVVVFDVAEFLSQYPGFAGIAPGLLQFDFNQAALICNNGRGSHVADVTLRKQLLYLLTAHIAKLLQGENGQPVSDVVGRISDATQGSVSVSAEWSSTITNAQAWYLQTQYGAMYWQATMQFRTMIYIAAEKRRYGPPDPRRLGRTSGF